MAITTTTVAKFRDSTSAPTAEIYLMLDAGGQPKYWEKADKGDANFDNGMTFLRNKKGYGLKLRYEGARRAIWGNMKPGTDVSDRLQRYIDALTPEEYGSVLLWEHGMHEATNIDLKHTALQLVCSSGEARFRGDRIFRAGDGYGKVLRMRGIGLLGHGKKEYGLEADDNDPDLIQKALFYSNGVVDIDLCSFVEGPTFGSMLEGWDLKERPLTNVSGSRITRTLYQRNGMWGSYICGNNGNSCLSFFNDLRDNGGGSRDASQVGGKSDSNMFHLNRVRGNNAMDGTGTVGHCVNNYYEFDLTGRGNTYGGEAFVREAARRSGEPIVGPHVDYIDAYHPFNLRQDPSGAYGLYPKDDNPTPVMRYGQPGTNADRPVATPWFDPGTLLIAGKAQAQPVESIVAAQAADHFYQQGDTVQPALEGLPHTCVRGGNGYRELIGVTAVVTPNSGGNLVLTGDISQLVMGTVVEFQGFAVQIDSLIQDPNSGLRAIGPYQLSLAKYPRLSTPGPLSYPVPHFEPQSKAAANA